MDGMAIFFILWMLVLPILAIFFIVGFPIFWLLIVPKISRKLTWDRFKKISYHFVADTSGHAYLLSTNLDIPEGVVRTKIGYRFLPQPPWKSGNPGDPMVENLVLKKFIWKDTGKPIWFDHAGKITSFNPATLAGLQQSKNTEPIGDPNTVLQEMEEYVKDLPKTLTVKGLRQQKSFNLRGDLTRMLKRLYEQINVKPLTILDPTKIKAAIDYAYPPSLLDALATNRETYGMKKRGQEYGKLILGAGLILGLVVIAILLIVSAK